jgi:two-component system sensor histidine kinase/response regulator
MSHELRTPLNAVLGFTQIMQRDASLAVPHQEYINIINRSGEHLLELINDILEMTKIESGRIIYQESSFDLWLFLTDIERMLRVKSASKNIDLSFSWTPSVPQFISTDKGKLRQILINLIGNAIKFTQAGSVSLVVDTHCPEAPELELHPEQSYLSFRIQDTGVGIAPEEQPQLFEPFSQTSSGLQSGEGTGLGLPISRKFVQLMGGDLQVFSQVNQGSLFVFWIRYQPSAALGLDSSSRFANTVRTLDLSSSRSKPKILAVEDHATNRLLLVKMLTDMGFEVQEAENGKVAIERWRSWQPDLILMDMRMPVMDGYTATQSIKESPEGQGTIIIALTASAFEEQRQQILNAGCDDFIRKPFQAETLLETIARYLKVELRSETGTEPYALAPVPSPDLPCPELDLPSQVKSQSEDWLGRLHQAASQGNDDYLFALLEELPPNQDSLKQQLKELVMDFRFDRILELVA